MSSKQTERAPIILIQLGGEPGPIGESGLDAAVIAQQNGFEFHIVNGDSISSVDLSQFNAIYMPTTNDLVQGGITRQELLKIDDRKADIAEFVRNGGGVIAFAQTWPGGWGWFPACDLEPTPRGGTGSNVELTQPGSDVLPDAALGVPYQQAFLNTCGGLEVLVREQGGQSRPLALGGDVDLDDCTNDDVAPLFFPAEGELVLSPANHSYRTILVTNCIQSVADFCDESVGLEDVRVLSVHSDEVEDLPGDGGSSSGDGRTFNDIIIECPNTVRLRAERVGEGNGRVYTIKYGVSDAAGNQATHLCQVKVPITLDSPAIDGPGQGYTVDRCKPGDARSRLAGITPMDEPAAKSLGLGVEFALEHASAVRLDVYDVRGRLVRSIDAALAAGANRLEWNGKTANGESAATGLYLLRVRAGQSTWSSKGVWIRD